LRVGIDEANAEPRFYLCERFFAQPGNARQQRLARVSDMSVRRGPYFALTSDWVRPVKKPGSPKYVDRRRRSSVRTPGFDLKVSVFGAWQRCRKNRAQHHFRNADDTKPA